MNDPPANSPPQLFSVEADDADSRLDVFLARRLAVGRSQVKKLLAAGGVRIDGRTLRERDKSMFLRAGSAIEVGAFQSQESALVIPQPELDLVVLAQGDGWVVVDKPAGMAVHPLSADERGTVLNAAVARFPAMQGVGEGALRSGVVHRLDVDTSGVLVLATADAAWQRLRRAFEEHRISKIYHALVRGRLTGRRREVMDLVVAQHRPARVRVLEGDEARQTTGARRCDMEWRSVHAFADATLIEVSLGTGFLHQIRVMMAHLGHPVLGDTVYGGEDAATLAPRQMLHAAIIEGGPVAADSPDPPDFVEVLARLRASGLEG